MSIDFSDFAGLKSYADLSFDIPTIKGLAGVQSMLDAMASQHVELVKGLDLAGMTGPVMPVGILDGLLDNAAGIGSLIEQLDVKTSVLELASVNALSTLAPMIEGIGQHSAVQLAPMLDTIKSLTGPAIVPPAISGILADLAAMPIPTILPKLPNVQWELIRSLDFETPAPAEPKVADAEATVPASVEVETYAIVAAVDRLTVAVSESVTGIQVMLHADARMRDKRAADGDRQFKEMKRLAVLAVVVPTIVQIVQMVLQYRLAP